VTSRPRIKREDFVVTVSEFRSYITSNDKWVSEEIPSEFFGADYEEYVDVEIESAKRSMSVWSDEAHSHHYNDAKEKLEASELLKIDAVPMPEAFMDQFKDWVVEHCSKEWKSFLSARRQKNLKAKNRKKQVTLASDVYYKLANFRKDQNLSIDDAVSTLLDGHQNGNLCISNKASITNSYEYVAAQQRILELKDVNPRSQYIGARKSLEAMSEAFLKTEPGKQMLRNKKQDEAWLLEDQEFWAVKTYE
jgi:macrodomain Ter protein organizer (MatP/YcbG family)